MVLPMPPGPDDGHETLVRQLRRERPHGIRPVHDACHGDQQIVHGSGGALWRRRPRGLRKRDRRHEAIPSPGDGSQVPVAATSVTERSTQRGDLNLEIALLDEGMGPDAGHEVALADQLAGALDQRDQDVQGAAAQTHGLAGFQQESPCREEIEWPEGDRASALSSGAIHDAGSMLVDPERIPAAVGFRQMQASRAEQMLVSGRSGRDHELAPRSTSEAKRFESLANPSRQAASSNRAPATFAASPGQPSSAVASSVTWSEPPKELRERGFVEVVGGEVAAQAAFDLSHIAVPVDLAARHTNDAAIRGKLPVVVAVAEARQQLAQGQVARAAEHDEIELVPGMIWAVMAAFLCKRSRRRTGFGGWPRGGRAVAWRHSGLSVWHPNGHRL